MDDGGRKLERIKNFIQSARFNDADEDDDIFFLCTPYGVRTIMLDFWTHTLGKRIDHPIPSLAVG